MGKVNNIITCPSHYITRVAIHDLEQVAGDLCCKDLEGKCTYGTLGDCRMICSIRVRGAVSHRTYLYRVSALLVALPEFP